MSRILFYCSPYLNGCTEKLQQLVSRENTSGNIDTCVTLESLSALLKDHRNVYDVAILTASKLEELSGFIDRKEHLKYLDIFLIVPDYEENTMDLGRKLYPRYMTVAHKDFGHLYPVLQNVINRSKQRYL